MTRRQDAHAGRSEATRNIHHDLIAEKLEIARTLGLVTDYRVSATEPPRRMEASVTASRAANTTHDGVRDYLAQLLDDIVPADNIVVTAGTGEAKHDDAREPARSADEVGAMRSFFLPGKYQVQRLAAAGAMLTCAAVVFNVGPFGNSPRVDRPQLSGSPTASAMTERPNEAGSLPQSGLDGRVPAHIWQAAEAREELPESVRSLIQPPPFSLAEAAAAPPLSPPRSGELDRHDLAAQVRVDHAAAEAPTIVGVWAPDAGTCSARDFQQGVLPTVINAEGAWAGETFCLFTKRTETETGWSVVAKCATGRERWTSNVRLTVSDNRLTWTSKRGTQAYTRCRPDVLMAQAR
jgi:hypothetical protein